MYTVKEVMKMYSILVCDDDKEIVEAIDSGCYDAASGRDQGDFEDP